MLNQHWEAAIFQDLGSASATMEASRTADFVGCLHGNCASVADAGQAYFPAERQGTEELNGGRRPDPKWVMALLLAYLHHYRCRCSIRISLPRAVRADEQWTRKKVNHDSFSHHHHRKKESTRDVHRSLK